MGLQLFKPSSSLLIILILCMSFAGAPFALGDIGQIVGGGGTARAPGTALDEMSFKTFIVVSLNNTTASVNATYLNLTYYQMKNLSNYPKSVSDYYKPGNYTNENFTMAVLPLANATLYFTIDGKNITDAAGNRICGPINTSKGGTASCKVEFIKDTVNPDDAPRPFDTLKSCAQLIIEYKGVSGGSEDYQPTSQSLTICPADSPAISAFGSSLGSGINGNMGFCFPALLIVGLLLAAMYYSGRDPLSLFDITTPRVPKGKPFRASAGTAPMMLRSLTKTFVADKRFAYKDVNKATMGYFSRYAALSGWSRKERKMEKRKLEKDLKELLAHHRAAVKFLIDNPGEIDEATSRLTAVSKAYEALMRRYDANLLKKTLEDRGNSSSKIKQSLLSLTGQYNEMLLNDVTKKLAMAQHLEVAGKMFGSSRAGAGGRIKKKMDLLFGKITEKQAAYDAAMNKVRGPIVRPLVRGALTSPINFGWKAFDMLAQHRASGLAARSAILSFGGAAWYQLTHEVYGQPKAMGQIWHRMLGDKDKLTAFGKAFGRYYDLKDSDGKLDPWGAYQKKYGLANKSISPGQKALEDERLKQVQNFNDFGTMEFERLESFVASKGKVGLVVSAAEELVDSVGSKKPAKAIASLKSNLAELKKAMEDTFKEGTGEEEGSAKLAELRKIMYTVSSDLEKVGKSAGISSNARAKAIEASKRMAQTADDSLVHTSQLEGVHSFAHEQLEGDAKNPTAKAFTAAFKDIDGKKDYKVSFTKEEIEGMLSRKVKIYKTTASGDRYEAEYDSSSRSVRVSIAGEGKSDAQKSLALLRLIDKADPSQTKRVLPTGVTLEEHVNKITSFELEIRSLKARQDQTGRYRAITEQTVLDDAINAEFAKIDKEHESAVRAKVLAEMKAKDPSKTDAEIRESADFAREVASRLSTLLAGEYLAMSRGGSKIPGDVAAKKAALAADLEGVYSQIEEELHSEKGGKGGKGRVAFFEQLEDYAKSINDGVRDANPNAENRARLLNTFGRHTASIFATEFLGDVLFDKDGKPRFTAGEVRIGGKLIGRKADLEIHDMMQIEELFTKGPGSKAFQAALKSALDELRASRKPGAADVISEIDRMRDMVQRHALGRHTSRALEAGKITELQLFEAVLLERSVSQQVKLLASMQRATELQNGNLGSMIRDPELAGAYAAVRKNAQIHQTQDIATLREEHGLSDYSRFKGVGQYIESLLYASRRYNRLGGILLAWNDPGGNWGEGSLQFARQNFDERKDAYNRWRAFFLNKINPESKFHDEEMVNTLKDAAKMKALGLKPLTQDELDSAIKSGSFPLEAYKYMVKRGITFPDAEKMVFLQSSDLKGGTPLLSYKANKDGSLVVVKKGEVFNYAEELAGISSSKYSQLIHSAALLIRDEHGNYKRMNPHGATERDQLAGFMMEAGKANPSLRGSIAKGLAGSDDTHDAKVKVLSMDDYTKLYGNKGKGHRSALGDWFGSGSRVGGMSFLARTYYSAFYDRMEKMNEYYGVQAVARNVLSKYDVWVGDKMTKGADRRKSLMDTGGASAIEAIVQDHVSGIADESQKKRIQKALQYVGAEVDRSVWRTFKSEQSSNVLKKVAEAEALAVAAKNGYKAISKMSASELGLEAAEYNSLRAALQKQSQLYRKGDSDNISYKERLKTAREDYSYMNDMMISWTYSHGTDLGSKRNILTKSWLVSKLLSSTPYTFGKVNEYWYAVESATMRSSDAVYGQRFGFGAYVAVGLETGQGTYEPGYMWLRSGTWESNYIPFTAMSRRLHTMFAPAAANTYRSMVGMPSYLQKTEMEGFDMGHKGRVGWARGLLSIPFAPMLNRGTSDLFSNTLRKVSDNLGISSAMQAVINSTDPKDRGVRNFVSRYFLRSDRTNEDALNPGLTRYMDKYAASDNKMLKTMLNKSDMHGSNYLEFLLNKKLEEDARKVDAASRAREIQKLEKQGIALGALMPDLMDQRHMDEYLETRRAKLGTSFDAGKEARRAFKDTENLIKSLLPSMVDMRGDKVQMGIGAGYSFADVGGHLRHPELWQHNQGIMRWVVPDMVELDWRTGALNVSPTVSNTVLQGKSNFARASQSLADIKFERLTEYDESGNEFTGTRMSKGELLNLEREGMRDVYRKQENALMQLMEAQSDQISYTGWRLMIEASRRMPLGIGFVMKNIDRMRGMDKVGIYNPSTGIDAAYEQAITNATGFGVGQLYHTAQLRSPGIRWDEEKMSQPRKNYIEQNWDKFIVQRWENTWANPYHQELIGPRTLMKTASYIADKFEIDNKFTNTVREIISTEAKSVKNRNINLMMLRNANSSIQDTRNIEWVSD